MSGMEVELDADSAAQHTWRAVWRDWVACCRETWMCQEQELFRDEGMTPGEWELHSSWRRHCPEPRICMRVFRMLSIAEAWSLAVAVGVAMYATYAQPAGWPVAVSGNYMIIFQLTSFAVALLLVFRTNAAYGRWWEVRVIPKPLFVPADTLLARIAFGRWLNCVRNSERMLLSWAPASEAHLVREFARWMASVTPAACAYLRRKDCYWQHCAGVLTPGEVAWLRGCDNPPVKVLMVLSGLVARTSLDSYQRAAIEAELSAYDIALGACERISRQAVPKAYTRHTSRFIIVYLTFLPFALWSYTKWLTLPVTVVLTFLLLGIENIGIQIENPVSVLPLHSFCAGLKTAALSMVKHHFEVHAAVEAGLAEAAVAEPAKPDQLPAGLQQRMQEVSHLRQRHAAANGSGAMHPAPPQPPEGMVRG